MRAIGLAALFALCAAPGSISGEEKFVLSTGPISPSLELHPLSVYRPDLARPRIQRALSRRHPAYLEFLDRYPGRWQTVWNEASGTPHRIYGDALDLGLPPVSARDPEELKRASLTLLSRFPGLFPVFAEDLKLEASKDLERFWYLRFRQIHEGIPVLGSRVEVWIAPGGRVILLGCDVIPDLLLEGFRIEPDISADVAVLSAQEHAGFEGLGSHPPEMRLVLIPQYTGRRLFPRLAWELRARGRDPKARWVYLISANEGKRPGGGGSARAGEVLGRWNRISWGTVSGTVRGKASPGLFPDVPWNPPELAPLSGIRVVAGASSAVTGPDGSFTINYPGNGGITITSTLRGPYCEIQNAAGPRLNFSERVGDGSQVPIDFNLNPTEFSTAQVNAFQEVHRAHDFVKALDPTFTAIDQPVITEVNIGDSCNAHFVPEGNGFLGFYRSGGCVNTAYSTVVYHEYSHFVLWKVFGIVEPMPAYNEGIADAFAALLTDQPVIGHAFDGEEGDGGLVIRDLSIPPLEYPMDLLREPHTSGLIIGGALWDLRQELGASIGSPAGLDLTRRLWFKSLFLTPPMISPDLTVDFLELDDDDGLLANGTPHLAEITSAFGRHGLHLPGELEIRHEPLPDSAGPGPFEVEAEVDSGFDFVFPTAVTLRYSIDGGFHFTAVSMESAGGAGYRAGIPDQVTGTTVRYFIEAQGTGEAGAVLPEGAPLEGTFHFAVGEIQQIFTDNFDGPERGWNHGIVSNGNPDNTDDWERGSPGMGLHDPENYVDGNLLDPPEAFSSPNCWGNDLALNGQTDKNYSPLSRNYLESPPVDCSGKFGIHLRFRRWLTVERYDRARILVNGTPIYLSPSNRDTLDTAWREMDYDISSAADGHSEVRIRFELSTNSSNEAGGWNLDDLEILATGSGSVERPSLTSIEPAFDFKEGGVAFILKGTGFTSTADTRLFFGESPVVDFEVVDPETITGVVPPSTPGPRGISIENQGGAASLPGAFTYFDLPLLEKVIPPSGDLGGGTIVTLHGEYYPPETEVWIGGNPLENFSQVGSQVLMGEIPPGGDIGPAEVVIRGQFGESRFPGAFTYKSPPVLDRVVPNFSLVEGGGEFVLRGNFFPDEASDITLHFGAREVMEFSVQGRTEITGVFPPGGDPGPVDVRITTPGGVDTLPEGFHYLESMPPTFIRGDADLSRKLDLTDAIIVLNFLFVGMGEVSCLDAADSTDDGHLDLSDPVRVLNFQFVGGPPPLPPHPEPGADVTGDSLDCRTGLSGG